MPAIGEKRLVRKRRRPRAGDYQLHSHRAVDHPAKGVQLQNCSLSSLSLILSTICLFRRDSSAWGQAFVSGSERI